MDILMMLILQPIKMIYAITCLCLLLFVYSMSYSFPNTGVLPPWLSLFLGTLFVVVVVAMVNRIVLLVSLYESSLLLYKNANDFWIFILCPATLPNSFIKSSSSQVDPFGFYIYNIFYLVFFLPPSRFLVDSLQYHFQVYYPLEHLQSTLCHFLKCSPHFPSCFGESFSIICSPLQNRLTFFYQAAWFAFLSLRGFHPCLSSG